MLAPAGMARCATRPATGAVLSLILTALAACLPASCEFTPGGGSAPGSAAPDAGEDSSSTASDGSTGDSDQPRWRPPQVTARRFAVFYQLTPDVLAAYADPTLGVPRGPDHAYLFAVSHASVPAARTTADRIHAARSDFYYAPCFDLNDHPGWNHASTAELASMARGFRDAALAAHADFFCFNEAYSTTPTSRTMRLHMMTLLAHLAEPAPDGARLPGVLFLTEAAATPSNWTSPATAFWKVVDQTSFAVVAEHYHGQGFVCDHTPGFLAEHLFALRRWLADSGDPAKLDIAANKFVVLHSVRYGPGPSGWAGADSNTVSLAAFQRALSKLAQVTRSTEGGINRISFAPTATSVTAPGVQPRIRLLLRWHYGDATAQPAERDCVAGAAVNCQCP